MKNVGRFLAVWSLCAAAACSQLPAPAPVALVPVADSMRIEQGDYALKSGASVVASDPALADAARYLVQTAAWSNGLQLTFDSTAAAGDIVLALAEGPWASDEAYRLTVDPSTGIRIECGAPVGALRAVSTLVQLLPVDASKGARIQALVVDDKPRYSYRGLHLDVSRHFQDVEGVKHVLDLMARYKLNKFHWHLTDDQGWRIEIKKYPLLTEKGAWRTWNNQDRWCMEYETKYDNLDFRIPAKYTKVVGADTLYGGYYTQDQIREVVAYAAARGIDVLPELDMPGHLMAAIEGYPWISCKGTAQWGTNFSDPLCVGNDQALQLVKDVYTEVAALFPYEYMHLGADEVERDNWHNCPKCQARIKKEGLKGDAELQSWFVREMERHFNSLGKKLIGWDEILDGGLSETATIMWWRDWAPKAVPTATASGNKAIMSPCFSMYLDAWEGPTTFEQCYAFDPRLPGLSDEQASHILGVQGNLWCETVPSMRRIEHMLFPRLMAVAETGWSAPSKKNWADFSQRVKAQVEWLDAHGVNYRIPTLTGFSDVNVFTDTISVWAECPWPNVEIRYTTDGSFPSVVSPRLDKPLLIDSSARFTFRGFRPDGTAGECFTAEYRKEVYTPGLASIDEPRGGLTGVWYRYEGRKCSEIDSVGKFLSVQILDSLDMRSELSGWLGLVAEGYINVPTDEIWTFALQSNDGSRLFVDGKLLVDNDGPHGDKEVVAQKALGKGFHKIRVEFFDMNNGGCLRLKINGKVYHNYYH